MTKKIDIPSYEVALSDITPSRTNPRREFDLEDLGELAESIKNEGVIQPILVRPAPDGIETKYELVCGERRFRAAKIVAQFKDKPKSIPAYVRELSDEQALSLQITENLQRKDVHPMEEAYAIKVLSEKYSIEEIGAKLGKKQWYINQRIKLNELAKEWQRLFYKNSIIISDALKIAVLPLEHQKQLMEDKGINVDRLENIGKIQFNEWSFNKYKGILSDATFDVNDSDLVAEAGACVTCAFNSSFSSLFPDSLSKATCSNITCFTKKDDANFQAKLAIALEDPNIYLVNTGYSDGKYLADVKAKGLTVLEEFHDFKEISAPVRPDYDEMLKDSEDDFSYMDEDEEPRTEADIRKEYQEAMEEYEKDTAEYNEKLNSGKYTKGFVVNGDGAGSYVIIELKETSKKAGSASQKIDLVKQQIADIKQRETRAKELDSVKVHEKVKEALKQYIPFIETEAGLSIHETIALAIHVVDTTEYSVRAWFRKVLGIKSDDYNHIHVFKAMMVIATESPEKVNILFAQLCRRTFLTRLTSMKDDPERHGKAAAFRQLALDTIPDEVRVLDLQQQEKATKRAKNVEKKIAELKPNKKAASPPTGKTSIKNLLKDNEVRE